MFSSTTLKKQQQTTEPPDAADQPPPPIPSLPLKQAENQTKLAIYLSQVALLMEQLKTIENFESSLIADIFSKMSLIDRKYRKAIADYLASAGFCDVVTKMKRSFNEQGIMKNPIIWDAVIQLLTLLWNMTNSSSLLCDKLIEADYLQLMLADLSHPAYIKQVNNPQYKHGYYVLRCNVGALHNCARLCEVKTKFYEENTIQIIQPLMKIEDKGISVSATLVLAEIMREDNESIMTTSATDGVIASLVAWIREGLQNKLRLINDGKDGSFSVSELVSGLVRLAVNEDNKRRIMAADPLPSFKIMIADDEQQDTQCMAVQAVSNLAFDKEVRDELRKDTELMELLNRQSQSDNVQLKSAVERALWIINERGEQRASEVRVHGGGHIMISYSWANKDVLLKLRDSLKAASYRVWMDIDDMSGSTLQAMAEAVEGASIVLICMSEKYKTSENCRVEAEYAYKMKKTILPLMMQRAYQPDGWLGIMAGAKLFVDFSGKYDFTESWRKLTAQLTIVLEGSSSQSSSQSDSPSEATLNHKLSRLSTGASNPVEWSAVDVRKWLEGHGMAKNADKFDGIDGRRLRQFAFMRQQASDTFFKILQDLGLDLPSMLLFSHLLANLR